MTTKAVLEREQAEARAALARTGRELAEARAAGARLRMELCDLLDLDHLVDAVDEDILTAIERLQSRGGSLTRLESEVQALRLGIRRIVDHFGQFRQAVGAAMGLDPLAATDNELLALIHARSIAPHFAREEVEVGSHATDPWEFDREERDAIQRETVSIWTLIRTGWPFTNTESAP